MTSAVSDDLVDAEADATILACLDLAAPKSFFLYAGAGSGKTRSLVEAIRTVCEKQGRQLSLSGRQIGVITYTNAACDEIRQRLEFDPRVEVSTIHAFAWALIGGYDADIREWLAANLLEEIAELEAAQAKGRAGSKAASDRARSIESKRRRHASLNEIIRFVYSPTGDNRTRDALNHAEVIAMTAQFLRTKSGLRRLLIARFPVLLIDESQDTSRRLMEALLDVQTAHKHSFSLGLFGDTMQRIYAEGMEKLADAIPPEWARPRKIMNHRCPKRVIRLINQIRAEDDRQEQRPRQDAADGVVRIFLAPETSINPSQIEAAAAARMADVTGDALWSAGDAEIKTLALEHLMSARRFGFETFFEPLYNHERMRTGLLDGSARGIGFFTRELLPLAQALVGNDKFAITTTLRKTSPLLDRDRLAEAGLNQRDLLIEAKSACDRLHQLLHSGGSPTLRDVLRLVAETGLFTIPDILAPFAKPDDPVEPVAEEQTPEEADAQAAEDIEDAKSETGAWRLALDAPFEQISKYDRYVRGVSRFDTHQGVKGLEFPRVMVVISDEEARGFMFNYGKLMGIREKTKADHDNEVAGKETSIDRTRRLFYVTCSRAEQSLAIVYYSSDPVAIRNGLIARNWFDADEIEIVC